MSNSELNPINLPPAQNHDDDPSDKGQSSRDQYPSPAREQNQTVAYLITAVIFFALGFLLAGLVNFSVLSDDTGDQSPDAIAQAVDATFMALTPSPTASPTVVPIQLTFSERDHVVGDENAPVTLVEFSDYRCPWCGVFAEETLTQLLDKYDGYIKFVYRDYPIFGVESIYAAHAAECASQQDEFFDYHLMLFDSQSASPPMVLNDESFLEMADVLSLDADQFSTCLAQDGIQQDIAQNFLDAQGLLGSAPTPTFLINGRRLSGAGSFEYFSRLIDEELLALGIEPPSS